MSTTGWDLRWGMRVHKSTCVYFGRRKKQQQQQQIKEKLISRESGIRTTLLTLKTNSLFTGWHLFLKYPVLPCLSDDIAEDTINATISLATSTEMPIQSIKYENMQLFGYSNNQNVSGTDFGVMTRHILTDKWEFDPNNDGYLWSV